jgi:hypothetical protein
LVSRRYRDNNSVSSRVGKLASDVEKARIDTGLKTDEVVSENFVENSVDRAAIAPNAVGSEQIDRGAVGTNELGIVNEINTDTPLVLNGPYAVPSPGTTFPVVYDEKKRLIVNTVPAVPVVYHGTISATWTFGLPTVTLDSGSVVTARIGTAADLQPGSTVVLNLVGSTYYIVSLDLAAPAFLRQVPLTLQSGWTLYDQTISAGDQPVQYGGAYVTKTSDNWVVCKGLIQAGTVASGTVLFTLPVGFRPAYALQLSVFVGGPASVNVYTNGQVVLNSAPSAGSWLSLCNIAFNVSTTGWNAMTLTGWTSTPDTGFYGVPSWRLGTYGEVATRGIIDGTAATGAWNHGGLDIIPPSGEYHILSAAGAGTTYVNVTGSTNASVTNQFRPRLSGSHSISGVKFPTTASTGWKDFGSFMNGWMNYGAPFPNASWCVRPDGLVMLKGLVRAGTIGTAIVNLPVGARPKSTLIISTISNESIGRMDITPGGAIVASAGSPSWFSLDGIMFAPEQ